MCTFGLSGCRVKPQRKTPPEDTQRERQEERNGSGRGEKRAKCWAVRLRKRGSGTGEVRRSRRQGTFQHQHQHQPQPQPQRNTTQHKNRLTINWIGRSQRLKTLQCREDRHEHEMGTFRKRLIELKIPNKCRLVFTKSNNSPHVSSFHISPCK